MVVQTYRIGARNFGKILLCLIFIGIAERSYALNKGMRQSVVSQSKQSSIATLRNVSLNNTCWSRTVCDQKRVSINRSTGALIIPASACGISGDGESDLRGPIQDLLNVASCESTSRSSVTVRFSRGTYNIGWSSGGQAELYSLQIANSKNVTIDGGGATFQFTNPLVGAFSIENNTNIALKNFITDYSIPPFSQGTVIADDRAAAGGPADYFVLRLDSGYPTPDNTDLFQNANVVPNESAYMTDASFAFVAEDGRTNPIGKMPMWLPHYVGCGAMAERISGTWDFRIYPYGKHRSCAPPGGSVPSVGEIAASIHAAGFEPGARAVLVARSSRVSTFHFYMNRDITLSALTTYASAGGSHFSLDHNEGQVIATRISFDIKPNTNRLISANGDGFNTNRGNRSKITITNSKFTRLADDVININTYAQQLGVKMIENSGRTIRIRSSAEWFRVHYRAGDVLSFARLGAGTALPTPYPVVVDHVVDGCSIPGVPESAHDFCIFLKRSSTNSGVPVITNDTVVVFNENTASAGSYFGNNIIDTPRGGVTVSSPGVTVENNTAFVVTWFSQVTLDLSWLQGPVPHDITFKNNVIRIMNPATFIAPAAIYADQRGTATSSVYTRSAPMWVRDIKNLRFINNTVLNTVYRVTPVKVRNAQLTPGARFLHQDENALGIYDAPRMARRALDGNRYCTYRDLKSFLADGGKFEDPYMPYAESDPTSVFVGECGKS